jgi:hypothetical protein
MPAWRYILLDSTNHTKQSFIILYQILLGERAHLIEFPSILLPAGVTAGSIVSIAVHQNITEEKKRERDFWALQDDILQKYGQETPQPPELKVRFLPAIILYLFT